MTRCVPAVTRIGSAGPTGPRFCAGASAPRTGAAAAVSASATSALTAARKREGESFAMTGLLSSQASNQLCCVAASLFKPCDDSMLRCEDKRPRGFPSQANPNGRLEFPIAAPALSRSSARGEARLAQLRFHERVRLGEVHLAGVARLQL